MVLQIFDTVGQERYQSVPTYSYKHAMGVILAYAIDDKESFDYLEKWMQHIKENCREEVCIVLVGFIKNEGSESKRMISFAEGETKAFQFGVQFFETSLKDEMKIEIILKSIGAKIKEKFSFFQQKDNEIALKNNENNKPKEIC